MNILRSSALSLTVLLLRLVIAISLVGCTTSSELLTPVYPAIEDHTTVRILTEMPEGAEQIAVLKETSVFHYAVVD